jgi:hypothetical protein
MLFYKARKTGTVMATSPMAESHDGYMCDFGGKILFFYIRIFRTSFNRISFQGNSQKNKPKGH